MILDHLDGNGELVARFNPEMLEKVASLIDGIVAVDKTNRVAFPDPEFALLRVGGDRYFPLSDRGNAVFSAMSFNLTSPGIPVGVREKVASRIAHGLERHGLDPRTFLGKTASDWNVPDEEYVVPEPVTAKPVAASSTPSLEVRVCGRPFVLEKNASGKNAARSIHDMLPKMPPTERGMCAVALKELGLPIGPGLEKYASSDPAPVAHRDFWLGQRVRSFPPGDWEQAQEAIDIILGEPNLAKQASMLEEFDRRAGTLFGGKIQDAWLTLFAVSPPPPKPVEYTPTQLEKVASICGKEAAKILRTQGLQGLDSERRRVASAIIAEVRS